MRKECTEPWTRLSANRINHYICKPWNQRAFTVVVIVVMAVGGLMVVVVVVEVALLVVERSHIRSVSKLRSFSRRESR